MQEEKNKKMQAEESQRRQGTQKIKTKYINQVQELKKLE